MMQGKTSLLVNGKFVAARPTAVHQTALKLTNALVDIAIDRDIRLLVPPNIEASHYELDIPPTPVGHMRGILWEQLSLPKASRGGILLNFCNMTPFVSSRALTMVHDAQVFTTPQSYGRKRSAWARLHVRVAGARQPKLLTVSDFSRRDLAKHRVAPIDRIEVIPNGVDHVLSTPAAPDILQRLGVPSRGYALALANVQPHKNIGILLQAFARSDLAGLQLVLTGRATREDFEKQGFHVPENVVFPGYVTGEEMRALQAQALAVCMPSLTEGFGMPPVEGMYLGTPAVIAPCGALPEVCADAALRADPDSPEDWAKALLRLRHENGLFDKLSKAGRRQAEHYTWTAAARRLLDVIDQTFSTKTAGT